MVRSIAEDSVEFLEKKFESRNPHLRAITSKGTILDTIAYRCEESEGEVCCFVRTAAGLFVIRSDAVWTIAAYLLDLRGYAVWTAAAYLFDIHSYTVWTAFLSIFFFSLFFNLILF